MTSIWIDALEFEDYGGFYCETQFAQEMGQGYLLALDRPGIPVAPAHTNILIDTPAVYRIWVRTKNWLRGHAPGRLKVHVDGNPLPGELGTQPNGQWYWDIAGDADLGCGQHTISVEDTTGYFGRFSAVILTSDMDYTPEHQVGRIRKERAAIKGIDDLLHDEGMWDLVVAGAGPSGIPAALAAARKGMRVALVHARPGLGGNASDEGTVGLDGAAARNFGYRESGIAEEIRRERDFHQISWESAFRHLVEREPNITIFYNQFVCGTQMEGDRISSIQARHTMDCSLHSYRAPFFVDATGDGWLGYYAGAKYRIGRESRAEYAERFAPEYPDRNTMSGCLMGSLDSDRQILGFYAEDAGEPSAFTAPDWTVKLPEGEALHRYPNHLHTGEWWVENRNDWDDLWDQETVRDELLRLSLGYFHWLKNSYSRRSLLRSYAITALGKYNARRESRRIIGDYVLTQNDCEAPARFSDAVSYCGWSLDVHHPMGIYSGAEGPYLSDTNVPIADIPFRCLYSKNVANLLIAGRCISVSHLALGSVRVESTLAALGQVVGTAAWYCLQKGIMPRQLYAEHIADFQQILLRDDLYIPCVKIKDPDNLAVHAELSASSVDMRHPYPTRRGAETGWENLKAPLATSQLFEQNMDRVELHLKNDDARPQVLSMKLAEMPHPAAFEEMHVLGTHELTVPAGFEGFLCTPAHPRIETEGYTAVGLVLEGSETLWWRKLDYTIDGRHRARTIDAHHWQIDYANSFHVRFAEEVTVYADCSADNVINSCNRILSPEKYAWVSDPAQELPQWLALRWERPVTLSHLQLTFDTDLFNPSTSYHKQPIVPATVRDFDVEA